MNLTVQQQLFVILQPVGWGIEVEDCEWPEVGELPEWH